MSFEVGGWVVVVLWREERSRRRMSGYVSGEVMDSLQDGVWSGGW